MSREDHLGVLVGISNLREGAELGVIGPAMGPTWRVLGVCGAGFGMTDLIEYANLVFQSELRPDVAVIGFGLHQLVDVRNPVSVVSQKDDFVSLLLRGDLRNAAVLARNSMWVYSRRRDVSVTVDSSVMALRASLMRRFGVPLARGELEKLSPWREMVRSDWPERFSQATLDAQEQYLRVRGVYERETYNASPIAFGQLLDVIESFRRRNTKVVLVLMPETTRLHHLIPAQALEVLQQRLAERFPDDVPPLLDYRQSVDDGGLVDHVHVNTSGRLIFSRRLGADLPKFLPGGTSLMARGSTQTRAELTSSVGGAARRPPCCAGRSPSQHADGGVNTFAKLD